jgi:hypothetical protein
MLSTLTGATLSGFVVYLILSNLLAPFRIVAPISITLSLIVFGLTDYYSREGTNNQYRSVKGSNHSFPIKSILNIIFITIYLSSIIIVYLPSENPRPFVQWEQITARDIVKLTAAIILCVFAPGYALVNILDRKYELENLPKFLLAYLFSILVTGLIAYVISSIGILFSHVGGIVIAINLVILGIFTYAEVFKNSIAHLLDHRVSDLPPVAKSVKGQNFSMLLVFASLLTLVVLFSYFLYNGTIIGDQWSHYGRSFMFLSGMYKDFAASDINDPYPPLFSAFLAAYFDFSNIPSVNAYVSIGFLNIIPVFAFYYFFLKWLPSYKKAALLAATLFMLSSGFGWVYLLNLANSQDTATLTPSSVMDIFY